MDEEYIWIPTKRGKPKRGRNYLNFYPMIMTKTAFREWMRHERRRGKQIRRKKVK